MKLLSIYTELFFKQVFENASPGTYSPRRSVVNSASYQLQLLLTVPVLLVQVRGV